MMVTSLHPDIAKGMQPHRLPLRQAFDARCRHIFLAQAVQHEAARHAGDIGRGGITEQSGRKDQVVDGRPENLHIARKQAVYQQKARPLLNQSDIELVHAATAADKAEMGVKTISAIMPVQKIGMEWPNRLSTRTR